MIKIMKLHAITLVFTLLLLASSLAQARTEPFPPSPNLILQTDSKPIHKPPVFSTEPNQDEKKAVDQFLCRPGFPSCPPFHRCLPP
ncbi:hypothetical protein EUTSA_v10005501mg [Eutrema salsugineum]|uniref:Uncharacterized protein n=1 Tax=Eutrema salsugineum TaxID=72664 RepID=V4L041_EUTSA|nr:hypothetical protein EUTSA_v10005501mg [Eutrema salsugineum]